MQLRLDDLAEESNSNSNTVHDLLSTQFSLNIGNINDIAIEFGNLHPANRSVNAPE